MNDFEKRHASQSARPRVFVSITEARCHPVLVWEVERSEPKSLPDPPKLSDNIDPTFENWEKEMIGKFRINFNYFPNEESKMAYTYNPTKADAE